VQDCGDERLNPQGAQIDFECNKRYNMLMNWLADMVHAYCDNLDLVKDEERKEHNSSEVKFCHK
jgi:hypothetical protein